MYIYQTNYKKNPYRKRIVHEIDTSSNPSKTYCGISLVWLSSWRCVRSKSYIMKHYKFCKNCEKAKYNKRKKILLWRLWFWIKRRLIKA